VAAYVRQSGGWQPAAGKAHGKASLVSLEQGQTLRLGDAKHSIELRPDRVQPLPPTRLREVIDLQVLIPLVLVGSVALTTVLSMPDMKREVADFTPQQLAPIRALLKPPEERRKERKKQKEKQVEYATKKKAEPEVVAPTTVAKSNVNKAVQRVQRITAAGPAVESLLKATAKIAGGGPKGYGDKGMGYKISPLIGKPPIAMAGTGVGPGMGGVRGMGNGAGGGIGVFSTGKIGKRTVAGTVVSAPARAVKVGGGTLARELIAKVINDHLSEVRGCYERALLKEAGLAGKLLREWTIDTSGRVAEVKTKSATITGAEVPNCIINSLKRWQFPPPKGGKVVVSYPFIFNSVGF